MENAPVDRASFELSTVDVISLANSQTGMHRDARARVGHATVPSSLHPRPVVKKIPRDLRWRKINFGLETIWYRRILWRLKEDSQFLRGAVQAAFALLCVWIGVEFHQFVRWGMSPSTESFVPRPPGVEGFLPISALISLQHTILTGTVNTIHPSGLFILAAAVLVSVVFKKAFCGWLCPIGTLSESLWMLGHRLLRNNWSLPRWLDAPLRSIKYLLLLFFLFAISQMDVTELVRFIYCPYNKVADIKMYMFFADIGTVTLGIILALTLLSVIVKNFWCRYLCPYGALLGLASFLSPFKITRKASTCIDCTLCTRVCPSSINVHSASRVWSDECMSCLRCVEVCPVKETLLMKTSAGRRGIPAWVFGSLIAGTFVAVTGLAMLTHHWQNSITPSEYARRFQELNTPLYQHNRGKVPDYGNND